jgi:hypothetical protein
VAKTPFRLKSLTLLPSVSIPGRHARRTSCSAPKPTDSSARQPRSPGSASGSAEPWSASARWTGQQVIEAFPYATAPWYLLCDRDGIYGKHFVRRVRSMGVKQVVTARKSPWPDACVKRLIGSIRRECPGHMIVLNGQHLRRILQASFVYHRESRTHQGLENDCPIPRAAADRRGSRLSRARARRIAPSVLAHSRVDGSKLDYPVFRVFFDRNACAACPRAPSVRTLTLIFTACPRKS